MAQKDVIDSNVPVTYIRVREIFHAYLRYQYGEFPLSLPEVGRLHEVFSTSLVPNCSMYRMNYSAFSQQAYMMGESMTDIEIAAQRKQGVYLPSEADRRKVIPFVLPHTVFMGRKLVQTNGFFQVTSSGYRQMGRIIEDEFWSKFIDFDRMFSLYCCRTGTRYSQDESVERFMMLIGMNMKFEDTFSRYWRKKKETDRKAFSLYSNKEHTERLKEFFEKGGK